jgi:hypothetical protein
MNRTALALAAASLFLVACEAKNEPVAAKPAEAAAPAAPSGPSAPDAKAMADMAAALSGAGGGANAEIANPQMKAFVESYEKVVEVVLTVKDNASAKAVGEKMRPLVVKLEEHSKALEALPENERAAASMQGLGRIMGATAKMASHVNSLPEDVQKTLNTEMEKMPQIQ